MTAALLGAIVDCIANPVTSGAEIQFCLAVTIHWPKRFGVLRLDKAFTQSVKSALFLHHREGYVEPQHAKSRRRSCHRPFEAIFLSACTKASFWPVPSHPFDIFFVHSVRRLDRPGGQAFAEPDLIKFSASVVGQLNASRASAQAE
jgi:hypothetical protein